MMNEWWFGGGFIAMVSLAGFWLMKPLAKKAKWLFFPILSCLVWILYQQWGSFDSWHAHEAKARHAAMIRQELARYKSPDALIAAFKARMGADAESPKAWYLLGKLYFSQGKWFDAEQSFDKALHLKPEDVSVQVYYLLAQWEGNGRQLTDKTRKLLEQVLKTNPKQPDALVIAASDAYAHHRKEEAIYYWQRLLTLVAPDSKEAAFLQKAIAKASRL